MTTQLQKSRRTIEEITSALVDVFESVKDDFKRQPISGPEVFYEKLGDGNGRDTAFIDFVKQKIGICVPFVDELTDVIAKEMQEKKEMSRNAVFDVIAAGLFAHEFGHYKFHPYELSLGLYLSHEATKKFKEDAKTIYPLFTDFQNNIQVCHDGTGENLKVTMMAHERMSQDSPLMRAMFIAYKHFIPDLEINEDISNFDDDTQKKIRYAVKNLNGMTITDSQNHSLQYSQLKRYADAVIPLLEKEKKKDNYGNEGSGVGLTETVGQGGGTLITPEMIKNLPSELREKIRDAIKKLAKDLSKDDYDELKKHFLEENNPDNNQGGQGIGNGTEDLALAAKETVDYYADLARSNGGITIRPKRRLCLTKRKVVYGRKEWTPSDSPIDLSMVWSGGRIIPGLSTIPLQNTILHPVETEVVPRLIFKKDMSGSMKNPAQEKCYVTAVGAMWIMSYHLSGADVGVSGFDTESTETVFSHDLDVLLGILCGYMGGGTDIDMHNLQRDLRGEGVFGLPLAAVLDKKDLMKDPRFKKYITKNANITKYKEQGKVPLTDLVIATDGGIANLPELLGFLKENREYRPTFIHTGGFDLALPGYDGETSGTYDGIIVIKAKNERDFINACKHEISNNLFTNYNV